jgi:hypothetical protein
MQHPPADSFFARFQAALRVYGWRWSNWSQLTARNGEVFELRGQLLKLVAALSVLLSSAFNMPNS